MKTVFTYGGVNTLNPKAPAWICMEQHGGKRALFKVTYGLQVSDNLPYLRAATELGSCIMHHLACEGELNNEGSYQ